MEIWNCVCGHDQSQHVKGGPCKGECMASDGLGRSICDCKVLVRPGEKPWQCSLSDRDWAIVFFAWDNACPLPEAVVKYAEFEKVAAEAGHHGHCVDEPEACFLCLIDDSYRERQVMRELWEGLRGVSEDLKYLIPRNPEVKNEPGT